MQIKKKNAGIFQVTLSGYELAALLSSARWICDGAKGELNETAIHQLKSVIQSYDLAVKHMQENGEVGSMPA